MHLSEYPVVIIGAGPTGLALGAELKRLGISSLILERQAVRANTSRAAAIHARTLEVLEPLGVTQALINSGIRIDKFCLWDKTNCLASVSFKNLHTPYPYVLACPQVRTEEILYQRIKELGGDIHRSCELIGLQSTQDSVQVQFKKDDEIVNVQAQWLIGCDGMHSQVRELSGIPFIGSRYEECFILADVEMNWPLDSQSGNLFFSEKGLMVVIPLPENHFRIIATVQESHETPTLEKFQELVNKRTFQKDGIFITKLVWASRFHIQHRIAEQLYKGRVILAGDAAHVHSPAGGQGMNTGIQDAISLAEALKEVLDTSNDKVLQGWQEKRLKIARSVVEMTDYMTKVMTISSPLLQFIRNATIRIVGKIPFVQKMIAEKLSELNNR